MKYPRLELFDGNDGREPFLYVDALLDRLRSMRDDKAPLDDLINELEEELR